MKSITKKVIMLSTIAALTVTCLFTGNVFAQEVGKGKIPAEQLKKSYKTLPWGTAVWDVAEAIADLKAKDSKTLWVDTRPNSFFKKGTVRGAELLIYNMKGKPENTLTKESLNKALEDAGLSADTATIAFFCQGPKCHRSYNASFAAVTEWGFDASRTVWFRDGYPNLFKEVQGNAKLSRKAKKYLSKAGMKQL